MQTSDVKRYILPFFASKNRDVTGVVETAAIYALAQLERERGGGLIVKQQPEKLAFITKMGYPLWLFPKSDTVLLFDGLNDSTYTLEYFDLPSTEAFTASLQDSSNTKEDYLNFLSDHANYFEHPKKNSLVLPSLITNYDFRQEFNIYRKEAVDVTAKPVDLAPILPLVQETTISSLLSETEKMQSKVKADIDRLAESLRQVNKLTSQYLTELDYAAEAATDEIKAKIKAAEELINPKVAKLNSDYKKQIAQVSRSFDDELESLQKLKAKTLKSIEINQAKIRDYEQEAKSQSKKNHEVYAKAWKEKSRVAKKEMDELKKELNRAEKSLKATSKQKTQKISDLHISLDGEIKFARAPLVELEAARDRKLAEFKRESALLLNQEKPVIDGLNSAIRLGGAVIASFQNLGTRDLQLKTPLLFYVPFYVFCYQGGFNDRYLFVAPSNADSASLGSKFKSALGMSKIKEFFTPRFKSIASLITQLQTFAKNSSQIKALGEKNSLLNAKQTPNNIANGLANLKAQGWLSDREYQLVRESLP